MYSPIGNGFGVLAGIFGAIVWAIGTFFLLLILIGLIVLLARFLWFGTKASQRYLELNGSPAPRMRTAATAPAAPAAAATTTAAPTKAPSATGGAAAPAAQRGAGAGAPAAKAPAAPAATSTTTTKPVTKPPTKPRTPPKPTS